MALSLLPAAHIEANYQRIVNQIPDNNNLLKVLVEYMTHQWL